MTHGAADESQDAGREIPSKSGPNAGGDFAVESIWNAIGHLPDNEAIDPLIGRSLGDVTPTRFIAEGGMGRVYEAEQRSPSRRVAVKVLRPGLFTTDTVRRFVREVSMLGSLRHPWITQVYSAGTYEIAGVQLPYFVMELIADALPLTEYATARQLSVADRLQLFRQLCDAVAYGHERGIVHRDLKPSNLLVDGFGHPKVIDFGVARGFDAGDRATTLTEAGQMIGTLQYMSPEQVTGRASEVDARADVYSLGAVLYELLAGKPVHDLRGQPLVEAAKIVHEKQPRPLRSANPAVSRHVAAIVHRCLAKDKELRFKTAGELSAAIDNNASGLSTLAAEGGWLSRWFGGMAVTGAMCSALILSGVYRWPTDLWARLASSSKVATAHKTPAAVVNAGGLRSPNAEVSADPNAALMLQPVEIHRDANTFRFAMRDVHQKDADAFLVENIGMKKWMDQFMFPRVSYWAPMANDEEGMLVYRFDLGGIAESIYLRAESTCWDFYRDPGGVGRGASAIDVSPDGETWIAIENNLEPRRWGEIITVDGDVPDACCGSEELWVRVRCITENAPVDNGYNVAQFARTRLGRREPAFEVVAKLRETGSLSSSQ